MVTIIMVAKTGCFTLIWVRNMALLTFHDDRYAGNELRQGRRHDDIAGKQPSNLDQILIAPHRSQRNLASAQNIPPRP